MMYRSATPDDGAAMLRLMESHPTGGGMNILYTRRPDAYQSYLKECPDAEIILCTDDDFRVLAQIVCLPKKLYIDREAQMVGYVTGLHKEEGAVVNILKMLKLGYTQSAVKHFFCAILDENQTTYDLLSKRGYIHPICGFTTCLFHPGALKSSRHQFKFHRAAPDDEKRLLEFYREAGAAYSYFPVFETMHDFAGLGVTDFFILENDGELMAAGALWDQQDYKQYIALAYHGVYKLAAHCNPLLRFLRYPPLPKTGTAAHFAYISFLLCRKDSLDMARFFLEGIAAAGRAYDFLAIGVVNGDTLKEVLRDVKKMQMGSQLCIIDYDKKASAPVYQTPVRFECALL